MLACVYTIHTLVQTCTTSSEVRFAKKNYLAVVSRVDREHHLSPKVINVLPHFHSKRITGETEFLQRCNENRTKRANIRSAAEIRVKGREQGDTRSQRVLSHLPVLSSTHSSNTTQHLHRHLHHGSHNHTRQMFALHNLNLI